MKHGLPDMLLGQFMGGAVDRLLGNVLEQVAKAATFLKSWTGDDPLNQLPSLITEEIVDHRGSRCRRSHFFGGTRNARQGMRNKSTNLTIPPRDFKRLEKKVDSSIEAGKFRQGF